MLWRTFINGRNNIIKTFLLANYTKCEIAESKKIVLEKCCAKLDKYVQRVDTVVRGAECSNAEDILNAILRLLALGSMPDFVLDANDIVRLPKYSPGLLLQPSMAERLAFVESHLQQLNDRVSRKSKKELHVSEELLRRRRG